MESDSLGGESSSNPTRTLEMTAGNHSEIKTKRRSGQRNRGLDRQFTGGISSYTEEKLVSTVLDCRVIPCSTCIIRDDGYTFRSPSSGESLTLGLLFREIRTRFEVVMGSECAICHKKPVRGNQKVERGKAKYLGGNGRKTTGITKRWFRPNQQSLRMQTGETSKRVRVCVQCLRSGLVVKRVVKKPFTIEG